MIRLEPSKRLLSLCLLHTSRPSSLGFHQLSKCELKSILSIFLSGSVGLIGVHRLYGQPPEVVSFDSVTTFSSALCLNVSLHLHPLFTLSPPPHLPPSPPPCPSSIFACITVSHKWTVQIPSQYRRE